MQYAIVYPVLQNGKGANGTKLVKASLKKRDEDEQQPERDRHLDTPLEANLDKHTDFVEAEDTDGYKGNKFTDRQKEWRQG